MRIFVDMDDILVNLLDEWLIHLNNHKGVTPKTEKIAIQSRKADMAVCFSHF